MNEFDEECLNVFLENQSQLFEEAVAETLEDAEAFLEDCMAVVVENIDEVKEFLEAFRADPFGIKRAIKRTNMQPARKSPPHRKSAVPFP